jgi:hypothetical protein
MQGCLNVEDDLVNSVGKLPSDESGWHSNADPTRCRMHPVGKGLLDNADLT